MIMKKISLGVLALAAFMTACDPAEDSYSDNAKTYTEQALSDSFSFTQADENGNAAADGNYFTFDTNPATVVTVYNLDSDNNENILAQGTASGTFKIAPKRGSSATQTFYVRTRNADGTYITAEKTVNVYVATELTPEMRLLASDAYGYKVWKWDTEFINDPTSDKYRGVWGNLGYSNGSGSDFANYASGVWWGCAPENLVGQLEDHSDTGIATGEEDPNAYMEFSDEGKITTYDANGNVIRSGKYSVSNYTGERNIASINGDVADWSLGTLTTTEGAILFPFQINWRTGHDGVAKPTNFEIMQLDANHLKLIYVSPGTGSWTEATWWAFKSNSDPEAALTNFGTKSWTWDTEFINDPTSDKYRGAWGNLGYSNGVGDDFANNAGGVWWGCAPENLVGQLEDHSDTGIATGEEDPNAYMTFNWKMGTVKTYDASGKEIRSGKYEITSWDAKGERTQASINGDQAEWAYGTLHTDAGSILFPFQINWKTGHDGVAKPTDFEIMQLDADHLKLIYVSPGTASWTEATWWAFKAK
jgi:hypothetical protein